MKSDSELVLGLITTIGVDTNEIISFFERRLKLFEYNVEVINVSKDIMSQFIPDEEIKSFDEFKRITSFMNLGNKLRCKTKDNAFLMKGVVKKIYQGRPNDEDDTSSKAPKPKTAYIINSIKHPDEIQLLRNVYGDVFHLIGVTSSKERRKNFLMEHKGLSIDEAEQVLERDTNEEMKQGQHTRDAFQHSDYFIWDTENRDFTFNAISRLVDLLFGDPFISPNFDEYAMFMAYAASLRSADLSRQVGAVVAKNKEVLSMGANDCPRFGGGLYWPILNSKGEYIDEKNGRDYMRGEDSNKVEQSKIIKHILENLGVEYNEENIGKIKAAGIGDLTEYGRVVHGEMEALLTCARNSISCRDATLYVTTFPCHNCAKHIIAAGIKRVVYIEPYPKSKAFDFYTAEISDAIQDKNKVVFEPFVGVGPRKFVELFSVSSEKSYSKKRKDSEGKKLEWKRENAELRNSVKLFNYIEEEENTLLAFEDESNGYKMEEHRHE